MINRQSFGLSDITKAEAAKVSACAAAINQQRPPTDIEAVEDALASARSLASRVQIMAYHLIGAYPSGSSSDACGEVQAEGVLPRLAQSAQETRRCIGNAMAELDRLQQQLG